MSDTGQAKKPEKLKAMYRVAIGVVHEGMVKDAYDNVVVLADDAEDAIVVARAYFKDQYLDSYDETTPYISEVSLIARAACCGVISA